MRKIIVSNLISLDGYFAGPHGEIDWFVNIADKEFNEYAARFINSIDTMLFGRVTYDLMYSFWPSASPETEDPRIIEAMNNSAKIVFSTSMDKAGWNNTIVIKNNIEEEMIKRKKQPGKDMVIYGSGTIVAEFSRKGLIDEYMIFVVPVVLGKGKSMFNIDNKLNLKLVDKKIFNSGMALLHYGVVE